MPRSRTVLKRQRQNRTRRERNKAVRSELRTAEKLARAGGEDGQAALRRAQTLLDVAAHKRSIHRNKAARKKSRLARSQNTSTS